MCVLYFRSVGPTVENITNFFHHIDNWFPDTLGIRVYQRYILNKLGNKYPAFFQYLGLTPAEIQTSQTNHNQNAAGATLELWNKYV